MDRSTTQFGEANLLTGDRDGLPFGFDDAGRPQLGHLHACRPEGILALVGAELLSPDASITVRECKRHCGTYISNPAVDRPVKRPDEKCPACRLKDKLSTNRVRKWRAAQKKGAKR